jgi:hypothetical protein
VTVRRKRLASNSRSARSRGEAEELPATRYSLLLVRASRQYGTGLEKVGFSSSPSSGAAKPWKLTDYEKFKTAIRSVFLAGRFDRVCPAMFAGQHCACLLQGNGPCGPTGSISPIRDSLALMRVEGLGVLSWSVLRICTFLAFGRRCARPRFI